MKKKNKKGKKDKFDWGKASRESWKRTKEKYPYYTKDINIFMSDPFDLHKQNYIDIPDTNAKILKNKHQSKKHGN